MTPEELSHKLRKEAISKGHSVQTVASGYSMFPFLRKGDLLTVEPVPMETIKPGDIVVFESNERWFAHRVIRISKRNNEIQFLLRGDTNLKFDPVVYEENYCGKVSSFQRGKKAILESSFAFRFWRGFIHLFGITYNFFWNSLRITTSYGYRLFRGKRKSA
jgi:signal peptidase